MENCLTDSYYTITEIAGDLVSQEQVERLTHRYLWAGTYAANKDVVEVGCGTGPGLTYLASIARSLEAGDYSQQMVDLCRRRLGEKISLRQFDAQQMPFDDQSKDLILMFEALYYVPDPDRFFAECRRVLRPGGRVLIANANKDLYDFNPSPNSHQYLGSVELAKISARHGMKAEIFGYVATNRVSARQRVFRPIKKLAVALDLVPKTNDGKKWLKRLVFGKLVPLPADIRAEEFEYVAPTAVSGSEPDHIHKVIYCCATMSG
jgi:ubiquinone/menaquinone biosynthesis C-methylase UbiE